MCVCERECASLLRYGGGKCVSDRDYECQSGYDLRKLCPMHALQSMVPNCDLHFRSVSGATGEPAPAGPVDGGQV